MDELISIRQLPIIEEHLHSLKSAVTEEVNEALSLVCTEETIHIVKKKRSELTKQFSSLEEQRKAIKSALLDPYIAFEAVYKECVSDLYKSADEALKAKISDVEAEQKKRCEDSLREYFDELCAANHLEWLTFDRTGVKVDLTSAKQKTPKKLRNQLVEFAADVNKAIETIATMEDSTEILVEYKQSLNLPDAISTVLQRHQRIKAEEQNQEHREAIIQQEAEAVKKEEEKTYECTFKVKTTMDKLKKLKAFLESEEIDYE